MTVEQVTNDIDREAPEVEPRDENAWKKVFWSDEDARLVGNFLQGEAVAVDESPEIFSRLAESTDLAPKEEKEMRNRQKKELRRAGEELLDGLQLPEVQETEETDSKTIGEDEYVTVNKMMGRTILQVAIGSLIRRGVLSPEGETYMKKGVMRLKDGGYVYDEWMGETEEGEASKERFPEVVIKAPVYKYLEGGIEKERSFGNKRLRSSLAHEINHAVRTLANKMMWLGVDPEKVTHLRRSRKMFVGGYLVGSNQQGSEGIGKFFSDIAVAKAANKSTHIGDLIEPTARRLADKLEGTKVDPDHRIALTALLHHLIQLKGLGYGGVQAEGLLALGMCGYGSLEKMPDLIRAGVMTKEKHEKMKLVAGDVLAWLTSKSEGGFKLSER